MLYLPNLDHSFYNQNNNNQQHVKKIKMDNNYESKNINFNQLYQYKYKTDDDKNIINSSITLNWDNKTNFFKLNYHLKSLYPLLISASIQINNDPDLVVNAEFYKTQDELNNDLLISSNLRKEIKYEDLKTISIKVNYSFLVINISEEYIIKKVNIDEQNYKKDIQIDEDQELNFNIQTGAIFKSFFNSPVQPVYQKLTLTPIKIKEGQNNVNLMSIKTEGTQPFDRVVIKAKNISNLPISNNKNIKLELSQNNNYIYYDKNMYYDLSKKEVIEGFGKNSAPGYIIPYDFINEFFPVLTIDIDFVKDVKISWKVKVTRPYFNETNNSVVKLNINSNNVLINNEDVNWMLIPNNFFQIENNNLLSYKEFLDAINK